MYKLKKVQGWIEKKTKIQNEERVGEGTCTILVKNVQINIKSYSIKNQLILKRPKISH